MAIIITPQTLATFSKAQLKGLITSEGIVIPAYSSPKNFIEKINEHWKNTFALKKNDIIWDLPTNELEHEIQFFLKAIDRGLFISTLDFFTKLTQNSNVANAWFYAYNEYFFGITAKLFSCNAQKPIALIPCHAFSTHQITVTSNKQIIIKNIICRIHMFEVSTNGLICYICGKCYFDKCEHIEGIAVKIVETLILDPLKKVFIIKEILIEGQDYFEPYLAKQFNLSEKSSIDPNLNSTTLVALKTARFLNSEQLHNLRQTCHLMAQNIVWSSINKKLSTPNPLKIFHIKADSEREIILTNCCNNKQFLYSINLFNSKTKLILTSGGNRKYHYSHNIQRFLFQDDVYIQEIIKDRDTDKFIRNNIIKYSNYASGIKQILPIGGLLLLGFYVPILHLLPIDNSEEFVPFALTESCTILDIRYVEYGNVLVLARTIATPQKKIIYLLSFNPLKIFLLEIPNDGMLNQFAVLQKPDNSIIIIQSYVAKIVIYHYLIPISTLSSVIKPELPMTIEINVRQMISTINNKVIMVEIGSNDKDIISIWSINPMGHLTREKFCSTRFDIIQDLTYILKNGRLSILCLGIIGKYHDITEYYLQGFDEDISFS